MHKIIFSFLLICNLVQAQDFSAKHNFTKQDTLRGTITPERNWWDVLNYTLNVEVFPKTKSIKGSNTITYKVIKPHKTLQIELQQPLIIDSITQQNKKLTYSQIGYSYFINLVKEQETNQTEKVTIYYHGKPKEAVKAPWDGGIVWSKDKNGNDFIASANQSIGASIWWPCKDHPADEASSMQITVTCPSNLFNVSNGRNIKIKHNNNHTSSYTWKVINPINDYAVSLNMAQYIHFGETYNGLKGDLDCNYYVLPYNLEKAKKQFKDVPRMLNALEYWLGPYPFYEDGYKIVETPYLGMEHQSCVAYGNKYLNGYMGKKMGTSTWGLKFDYIIIHESAHEWFANNITCKDVADLWIHEAFTTYSESLYIDYHYGTQAANEYVQGLKLLVLNDRPIKGIPNVHNEGSSDMYFKGSLILHTLRQIVNNDTEWRNILKGLNKKYYHKTVTEKDIVDFINAKTSIDLTTFFKQYIHTIKVPKLLLKQQKNKTLYKWVNTVDNFKMPVKIFVNGQSKWITPNKQWKTIKGNIDDVTVDKNFYIDVKKVKA